jgi:hypothetical protein
LPDKWQTPVLRVTIARGGSMNDWLKILFAFVLGCWAFACVFSLMPLLSAGYQWRALANAAFAILCLYGVYRLGRKPKRRLDEITASDEDKIQRKDW